MVFLRSCYWWYGAGAAAHAPRLGTAAIASPTYDKHISFPKGGLASLLSSDANSSSPDGHLFKEQDGPRWPPLQAVHSGALASASLSISEVCVFLLSFPFTEKKTNKMKIAIQPSGNFLYISSCRTCKDPAF